jgi:hypothetical protein
MPIVAKSNGGGNYEPAPTGLQQAVCVFVEDIGTHTGSYQGKPIQSHQIVICWELAEKMTQGENIGKPFMLSKFYTLSLNEKANLRKDLEAWRGRSFTDEELKGFDLEKLIGINCMVNIVEHTKQDGRTGQKIGSIAPKMKALPDIQKINQKPPAWIDEKRKESIEYAQQGGAFSDSAPPPNDSDIPF